MTKLDFHHFSVDAAVYILSSYSPLNWKQYKAYREDFSSTILERLSSAVLSKDGSALQGIYDDAILRLKGAIPETPPRIFNIKLEIESHDLPHIEGTSITLNEVQYKSGEDLQCAQKAIKDFLI